MAGEHLDAETIRSRVLDAVPPTRLRVHALRQTRESLVEYEVDVDHEAGTWAARDLTHGISAEFRDGRIVHGDEITPSRGYRHRVTMVPLTLVFPELLPIWGRPGDDGVPLSTEELDENRELITVRWLADDAMRSTLVVDRRFGMVTRYDNALSVVILDAIEPR